MSPLRHLIRALLSLSVIRAYKLDSTFDASDFLKSFDFIDTCDKYTGGCARYVSHHEAASVGLARIVHDRIYLGVDNNSIIDVAPHGGRKSVRVESHHTIDSGIIIADFEHLPPMPVAYGLHCKSAR